jgi:hypothetical protein
MRDLGTWNWRLVHSNEHASLSREMSNFTTFSRRFTIPEPTSPLNGDGKTMLAKSKRTGNQSL